MNSYAILLVEDERAFALGLKRELEAAGSKVECVQSADQGLIRAKEGTFDAVVTDLHLPGRLGLEPFSGLRLVTEVQRVAPRLPVILMTAFHTADAAIEAIKLGAYDYVTKPLPSSQGGLEEFSRFAGELLLLIEGAVLASRPTPDGGAPDEPSEGTGGLIGRSRPMQTLYKEIGRLAGTSLPVLISGEAGTGKELVARTLHQHSHCAAGPFIVVNCLGVSESSILSELLGVENAVAEPLKSENGMESQAQRGTVFLDEISGLSPAVLHALSRIARQSSILYHPRRPAFRVDTEGLLLRQELEWPSRPSAAGKAGVRVLAATHSDPKLLWRRWPESSSLQWLAGALTRATIHVPPLCDRLEDVPALVRCFMKRFGAELGLSHVSISAAAMEFLQQHNWPGNVTELEHVVSLSLLGSRGLTISRETVAAVLAEPTRPVPSPPETVASKTRPPPVSNTRPPPNFPDYESIRQIGEGAYGQVWLVRNVAGGFRAAKIIYRELLRDTEVFEQEFSALVKLETISQNINGLVRILHIGRNDKEGCYYYMMELADDQSSQPIVQPKTYVARTLTSEIRKRGMLSLNECVEIGISLAKTLDNLHSKKLVHRDIKPSNIIFVNGMPKLADIGLVTDVGRITYRGTPGYIAPEGPGKPPADLYSLGKVIYEMMTGADRLEFPKLPSDAPATMVRLQQILLKACDEDLRQRYQSAMELRATLTAFQAQLPP